MILPAILNCPPKLLPVIKEFNNYGSFLLYGGRSSGKTHFVARFILYLSDVNKCNVLIGREVQVDTEISVYAIFKNLITEYKLNWRILADEFRHNSNGSTIRFTGLQNYKAESIKGGEKIDIIWVDEAQSISQLVLDNIIPTIIRNANAKMFFTMNRKTRNDPVYQSMSVDKDCLTIGINYLENPFNIEATIKKAASDKEFDERKYRHIWLGEPLSATDDYLFNFDKIHKAIGMDWWGDKVKNQRVIGFDLAAQGNDSCVASILDRETVQHWNLKEQIIWNEPDTMVSTGRIVDIIGRYKPEVAILDKGGLGKPIYDRLIELGIKIYGFEGQGSTDKSNVANARAEGYFTVKEFIDNGFLILPKNSKELTNELEKIKFKYQSNGRILIQNKIDMKRELGFSPDRADSLMMAIYGISRYLGRSEAAINNKIIRVSNRTRR
jgi:hypothetical protein